MARVHSARTRAPVEVGFSCPSCGFAARAVVEGEGVGTAASYIVIDRKNAREAAAEEAVAEARHDAKIIASILPCPKCQKRSRLAVAVFVVRALFEVTGFVALGVVLWWLTDLWLRWVLLGLMVGAAVGAAKRRRTRYRLASTLVLDIRPEAVLPRAQVVSLPAPPAKPATAPEPVEPTPMTDEPHTLR
jgi:hypothetical protein